MVIGVNINNSMNFFFFQQYLKLVNMLLMLTILLITVVQMTFKRDCLSKAVLIPETASPKYTESNFQRTNSVETPGVDSTNEKCVLQLQRGSINKFRHDVWYSKANFVYLKLEPGTGVNIVGNDYVVGETIWTWTYFGKDGGLQFLKWPIEFGLWSMDLLGSAVIKYPEKMKLKMVSGNCSHLEVGELETDEIISNALTNLTEDLIELAEKYASSFFCYKKRIFIQSKYLYGICKQVVCPIDALEYKCCSYYYNTTEQNRSITCNYKGGLFEFVYESFSWILPVVLSFVLFAFSPFLILYCFHKLSNENSKEERKALVESEIEHTDDAILLNGQFPVTLLQTFCLPIKCCFFHIFSKGSVSCKLHFNRLIRIVIPFLSLIIIGLQVFLDYWFLYSYVVTCVEKGVPMGFRSIIAGYEASKDNFLQILGGPYVAICLYICVTCILLVMPVSISDLFLSYIDSDGFDEGYSPLFTELRKVGIFGSVKIKKGNGFYQLYRFLLAKFFMMLNIKFWKHILLMQYTRCMRCKCNHCTILYPFYVLICIIEIFICLIVNGIPIIAFGNAVIQSYYIGLSTLFAKGRHGCCSKVLFCFLTVTLLASFLLFLYMFCTIFLDACLFLTRIAIFTFIGIVVYPKLAYGYIIFALTVIYYISQSVREYSLLYQGLLQDTVSVCGKIGQAHSLLVTIDGFKGVKKSLFENVIENHFPKRKQVFVSLVKVCIILTVLGFSINILTETYGFQDLNTVMHVGTALFICALPQMAKNGCRYPDEKIKRKRFRKALRQTVKKYIKQHQNRQSLRRLC